MSYTLQNAPPAPPSEEEEDLEILQHDDEGRKILNFRDLKEFYNYLVKSQLAEARNKMGKAWLENFQKTNYIRVSFKDEIARPDNYKKMVELHQENVNHSEVYNKMKAIEKRIRINEGPKQYLCSKCGLPKKGHICKAGEYGAEPPPTSGARRKTRDHLPAVDENEQTKRRRPGSYTADAPIDDTRPKSRGALIEPQKQNVPHPLKDNRLTVKSGGQVLVIGGGIAGLTAARELKRHGMSVIILEARDRIGGRIHTITSDELNQGRGIDIGASFVYRAGNNPFIHDLCSDRSLLHPLDGHCILYDSNGKLVSSTLNANAENIFNESLNEISNSRKRPCNFFKRRLIRDYFERTREPTTNSLENIPNTRDQPLGTFLSEYLTSWQKKNSITVDTWAVLNWYLANFESLYGTDVSKLSLNHFDQDDTSGYNDGANCLIYQGYGFIVNHLSQGLDVRLGTQVERISYDSNRVKVMTSKGIYEANHLVCTLPLGILKEGNVQFSPPLPTEKLEAISRLGNGLLNKLILFFPNCFWDKNADFIGNVNLPQSRGEFFIFINMEKVVQSPILVGLVGGQAAEALETKTGEEVVGLAMKTLHRIYGNAVSPSRAVVTRWANDPYAKGAFSYLSVGCTGDEYDILAQPIGDKIFFAGEATNRAHASTVTGAYLSGQRAATEIIQLQAPQYDMMDSHLINPPPPLNRPATPPTMHQALANSPNPLHNITSPIFANSPGFEAYLEGYPFTATLTDEQLQ